MWFGASLAATEESKTRETEESEGSEGSESGSESECEETGDNHERDAETDAETDADDSDYNTQDAEEDEDEDDDKNTEKTIKTDFQSEMRNVFISRLSELRARDYVDMKYENQMFALEARLHFLFFWLNDKENWLADMNQIQLEFLKDIMQIEKTEKKTTTTNKETQTAVLGDVTPPSLV